MSVVGKKYVALYNATLRYCERRGLISQLKRAMVIAEHHRFKKQDISKEGLHLLDAVHCLYDRKRTEYFLKEIDLQVSKDSNVLEAGIGTGILSFYAAMRGRRVVGYEINKDIYALARSIESALLDEGILENPPLLKLQDATKVRSDGKIDVLINENVYTGMFFEKQVQIARCLKRYLARDGRMIPSGMRSYIALGMTRFPRKARHAELFVPLHEKGMRFRQATAFKRYDDLDFKSNENPGIDVELQMPIRMGGMINSVLIYTEVVMPSGKVIRRNATTFFNNDIIVAHTPTVRARKGEIARLRIAYPYGAQPEDARLEASIMA